MQSLQYRLKSLRQESGLLQKDIAEKLNITTSAYGYYEQGKRTPDSNTLDKLAGIFSVSTDYLLGRTDIRQTTNQNVQHLNIISENNNIEITEKDKRDIAKDLEHIRHELLSADDLMFDGHPMSDESIENILAALEIGMEQVRRKNKLKYTPKKYRNS